MAKAPRSFDEPMQKRLIVSAAKRAAVQLWGDDGLNEIAQALPDDTREEFFRVVQVDDWIAVRHFIRWMYVTHHGPAKLSLPKIREYIDRTFDLGYGVVRRSMLRMADPAVITPRVGPMWREDQTHGLMTSTLDPGGKSATFRLADSPYTETPQTRAGVAENYRYAYSLTRAKDVTETHSLEKAEKGNVLAFRIRWT